MDSENLKENKAEIVFRCYNFKDDECTFFSKGRMGCKHYKNRSCTSKVAQVNACINYAKKHLGEQAMEHFLKGEKDGATTP